VSNAVLDDENETVRFNAAAAIARLEVRATRWANVTEETLA
jgi:hypothetical protein